MKKSHNIPLTVGNSLDAAEKLDKSEYHEYVNDVLNDKKIHMNDIKHIIWLLFVGWWKYYHSVKGRLFHFTRRQAGSWNVTIYLSPHDNIFTIPLIAKLYLYNIPSATQNSWFTHTSPPRVDIFKSYSTYKVVIPSIMSLNSFMIYVVRYHVPTVKYTDMRHVMYYEYESKNETTCRCTADTFVRNIC